MIDLTMTFSRKNGSGFEVNLFAFNGQVSWPYGPYPVHLQEAALTLDPDAPLNYGQALSQQLFDPSTTLFKAFEEIQTRARDRSERLRCRICFNVSPNDQTLLNGIAWELLTHPLTSDPLLVGDDVLFSRFMNGDPVPFQASSGNYSNVLAAVANPADPRWNLNNLDVQKELEPVRQAAQNSSVRVDYIPKKGQRCTYDNILASLNGEKTDDRYDIFYLACHGNFSSSGYAIFLEKEDGSPDIVRSEKLIRLFKAIRISRPRLVILTACDSATPGLETNQAFLALGPKLAQAGVQAVIAMQGKISQETARSFMSVFFNRLARGESIDYAVAQARLTIRLQDCEDWWMPVLYMTSASPLLWNNRSRQSAQVRFVNWSSTLDGVSSDIRNFSGQVMGSGGDWVTNYPAPTPPRPGSPGGGTDKISRPSRTISEKRDTARQPKYGVDKNKPDFPNKRSPDSEKVEKKGASYIPITAETEPSQKSTDLEREAKELFDDGYVYRDKGDHLQAIGYFERARDIKRQLGDKPGEQLANKELAQSHTAKGLEYLKQERARQALEHFQQAQQLAETINANKLIGYILHFSGLAYLKQQDDQNAIRAMEKARQLRKLTGDLEGCASTCWELTLIYERRNDLLLAAERLTTTIEIERALGKPEVSQHEQRLQVIYRRLRGA